jgi:hypothetical protein
MEPESVVLCERAARIHGAAGDHAVALELSARALCADPWAWEARITAAEAAARQAGPGDTDLALEHLGVAGLVRPDLRAAFLERDWLAPLRDREPVRSWIAEAERGRATAVVPASTAPLHEAEHGPPQEVGVEGLLEDEVPELLEDLVRGR